MKHIILVGFMGCGKTRVGRVLAKKLKLPFVDMDTRIVKKAGMPITDIFAQHGESYFRELETKVLVEALASKRRTVISTGGGVPMQKSNQPLLKAAIVVYIKAPVEVLMVRLVKDKKRPILQGGDLRDKITTLLDERNPVYEQVSNMEVLTNDGTVDEVVGQIIEKIVEKSA